MKELTRRSWCYTASRAIKATASSTRTAAWSKAVVVIKCSCLRVIIVIIVRIIVIAECLFQQTTESSFPVIGIVIQTISVRGYVTLACITVINLRILIIYYRRVRTIPVKPR